MNNKGNLKKFCLIDAGSTTTKAFLFLKDDDWHYYHTEAPTTVEMPYEDVTAGVLMALEDLEGQSGEKLIDGNEPALPVFSTSSAGGGLAVVVAGLVLDVTTRSAERVALGAGSLILDYIALDDGRTPYKKIDALKKLRPDMVLLAGGFDGGAVFGPVFLAELLTEANLHPKLSADAKLPLIYAGNKDARKFVEETLGGEFSFHPVPNIRPESMRENLEPAREAIHDLFMDHVMSQAPGYEKYNKWVSSPIIPTPGAFSKILSVISKDQDSKILAIDIGGATTDVFTADKGEVFRTVSANLGMSYSILNVVKTGGLEEVRKLLDFEIDDTELLNRVGNKYVRPTTLPSDMEDSKVECAAASVAIREAVKDHIKVKVGLSLSRHGEELSFSQIGKRKRKLEQVNIENYLEDFDMIIGSGGILSHTPRETASLILINGLTPHRKTELAVDSMFIFPHLGVLSDSHPELAKELFYKFGMVKLGTAVAPSGETKPDKDVVKGKVSSKINGDNEFVMRYGEMKTLTFDDDDNGKVKLKVKKLKLKDTKFEIGKDVQRLIIDARGRPLRDSRIPYLPRDYRLPQRNVTFKAEDIIYEGEIRLKRELAIPGEVLVSDGQQIAPGDIIAKSTRQFLRPFFLNIAQRLKISPEELDKYFKKSIGDIIEKDEIIAENRDSMLDPILFRAPVSGKIEKVLPEGTVVVREKPEHTGELVSVRAARDIGVKPEELKPYLKVKEGQEIEAGQHVAEVMEKSKFKVSRSPIRGKVKSISEEHGLVIIESLVEELEINAWIPGKVEKTNDRGCTVANKGLIIKALWGYGGERFGTLVLDELKPGAIAVQSGVNKEKLVELEKAGVAGLITGGINLKDIEDLKPPFTVISIEGFGEKELNPEVTEALKKYEGEIASINGTTQLRVGVKRPQIILCDDFTNSE
ncbi:MAG: hypothetical protein GF307_01790 [candidate division Zixibacteria bacterium]|nr:hypothetical protein [candidate division Zixibacteria bacterium]